MPTIEYHAKLTLTKRQGNGEIYKKCFNGTCAVGVNKRMNGALSKKAEAYLQAVEKSLGIPPDESIRGEIKDGYHTHRNDKILFSENLLRYRKLPQPTIFLVVHRISHKAAPQCDVEVAAVQKPSLPSLEVVSRVAALPIVEAGIDATEKVYHKIRDSNSFIAWYLSLYERSLATGVQLALPAVQILETPLHQLDKFLCKSLDIVEKRVPSIHMPPETMYSETRRFVLTRADSVKQLGSAVLDSRVTAVTADAFDRALTTADKYVDKYLPPDYQDATDVAIIVTSAENAESAEGSGRARAAHAVQHGARLRRKLQRRLTRQALAEAKAIKEQIHVLVYVAELVATDPVLAWQKAKELYHSLSQPEPENQARPATLEELLVLLTRETARKAVHFANYAHTDLPKNVRQGMSLVTKHLSTAADSLLKAMPVETAISEVRGWQVKLQALLIQIQEATKTYLEHLAIFVAGNEEREKLPPRNQQQRDDLTILNGLN